MPAFATRRPLAFAALVMLLLQAIVLLGLLASNLLGVAPVALDLPIMIVNCLVAIALIGRLRWWSDTGFNRPSQWRNLHLLLLPILLLLGPTLLVGPELPAVGKIIALVLITLLIGFQEEAIFRGVLLRALMPRGVMQAVLISALLFAVIHANSLLVGRDPVFVGAQILASFLGGIGLAALRLRLNSIWPLVLLHAFNDFLQFTAAGGIEAQQVAAWLPLLKIAIAGTLAIYGLYLLRGYSQLGEEQPATGPAIPLSDEMSGRVRYP
jgi:uncharacterized protein